MTNHTQEQLQTLLEQSPAEFVKVVAEVCYGWIVEPVAIGVDNFVATDGSGRWIRRNAFNPLEKSERGRSQAFELAVKFDCFPYRRDESKWIIWHGAISKEIKHENPQAAIVIASILTSQKLSQELRK